MRAQALCFLLGEIDGGDGIGEGAKLLCAGGKFVVYGDEDDARRIGGALRDEEGFVLGHASLYGLRQRLGWKDEERR